MVAPFSALCLPSEAFTTMDQSTIRLVVPAADGDTAPPVTAEASTDMMMSMFGLVADSILIQGSRLSEIPIRLTSTNITDAGLTVFLELCAKMYKPAPMTEINAFVKDNKELSGQFIALFEFLRLKDMFRSLDLAGLLLPDVTCFMVLESTYARTKIGWDTRITTSYEGQRKRTVSVRDRAPETEVTIKVVNPTVTHPPRYVFLKDEYEDFVEQLRAHVFTIIEQIVQTGNPGKPAFDNMVRFIATHVNMLFADEPAIKRFLDLLPGLNDYVRTVLLSMIEGAFVNSGRRIARSKAADECVAIDRAIAPDDADKALRMVLRRRVRPIAPEIDVANEMLDEAFDELDEL